MKATIKNSSQILRGVPTFERQPAALRESIKACTQIAHRKTFWSCLTNGRTYHCCFLMCSMRNDMLININPRTFCGSRRAASNPTTPE